MSKVTVATVKSFVKKNRGALLVHQKSSFDGMTDCVQRCDGEFTPAREIKCSPSNDLGIGGIWLVGSSRDYCNAYKADGFTGFSVDNCCGSFIVAIAA